MDDYRLIPSGEGVEHDYRLIHGRARRSFVRTLIKDARGCLAKFFEPKPNWKCWNCGKDIVVDRSGGFVLNPEKCPCGDRNKMKELAKKFLETVSPRCHNLISETKIEWNSWLGKSISEALRNRYSARFLGASLLGDSLKIDHNVGWGHHMIWVKSFTVNLEDLDKDCILDLINLSQYAYGTQEQRALRNVIVSRAVSEFNLDRN